MTRLTKKQKEFLLKCIGEGLETDEINARARMCKPAFSVTRQDADYYRKSRGLKLKEIAEGDEFEALRSGLATRAERIARLEKLFNRVEKDLLESNLMWLPRKRTLGSGEFTQVIDELQLNAAEIKIHRDLLDDIAKEMNQRTYQVRESLPAEDEEEDSGEIKVTVRYEKKSQSQAQQAQAEE
jgi:hypothetical protein